MTPRIAYLVIFIGVLGHASSEFFAVLSTPSGPEVSVWRFLIGALGLSVALLLSGKRGSFLKPLYQDGPLLTAISLAGVTGTYLAFHIALDFASIVQVGTVVTTIPIFVGLTNLILNKIPLTAPKVISGLAAIAGVALLWTDGYLAKLAGDAGSLTGIGLAIICAALGSLYAVAAKPLIARHGSLSITTVSTIIGAIGLWVIVGAGWRIWVNPLALADMEFDALWPLLTLGIWNTTIAQLAWLGGLAAVPDITRGSYLFFLKPVIAALLAVIFLSQAITPLQIAAIFVICGAVLLEFIWPHLTKRVQG